MLNLMHKQAYSPGDYYTNTIAGIIAGGGAGLLASYIQKKKPASMALTAAMGALLGGVGGAGMSATYNMIHNPKDSPTDSNTLLGTHNQEVAKLETPGSATGTTATAAWDHPYVAGGIATGATGYAQHKRVLNADNEAQKSFIENGKVKNISTPEGKEGKDTKVKTEYEKPLEVQSLTKPTASAVTENQPTTKATDFDAVSPESRPDIATAPTAAAPESSLEILRKGLIAKHLGIGPANQTKLSPLATKGIEFGRKWLPGGNTLADKFLLNRGLGDEGVQDLGKYMDTLPIENSLRTGSKLNSFARASGVGGTVKPKLKTSMGIAGGVTTGGLLLLDALRSPTPTYSTNNVPPLVPGND